MIINHDIQDVFKDALSKYGNPGHFFDNDKNGLEEIKSILKFAISNHLKGYGKNGEIYFDYIDNPEFNALATISEDYEFITLFSGTVFHLYRIYFAFMSDPLVLPLHGKSQDERISDDVINSILSDSFISQQPKDKLRLVIAQNLALITCLLIVTHEIGHIANCHIKLLQTQYGIKVYEELPVSPLNNFRNDLFHAFEWEADEYSGVCTYLFLHHFGREFPAVKFLGLDHTISLCSLMLFLCIHKLSGASFDTESYSHPSPFDRWIWMTESIETHEQCKVANINHEDILKGIGTVLDFWSRHKLLDKTKFKISENSLQQTKLHYDKVKVIFKSITIELEKLRDERNLSADIWFETVGINRENLRKIAFEKMKQSLSRSE